MKIHFVWLGPNKGAHCTATPVAVAGLCPDHEVWLWILREHGKSFLEATEGTGVQLMILDSVEGPLGAQNWIKDAFKVITTLVHYKAWAAAKDLAVLLIMYRYGGLYLDTTCLLATDAEGKAYESKRLYGGVKAQSLPKALKALAKAGQPMLPLVVDEDKEDDTFYYEPGKYSVQAITTGWDKKTKLELLRKMPHLDVWSYFSPSGHMLFLEAAVNYVKRATIVGLDDPGSTTDVGRLELEGHFRNEFIGTLIIYSIFDGVFAMGLDETSVLKICWGTSRFKGQPANLPGDGGGNVKADIVPALGIIKHYKGSWRT